MDRKSGINTALKSQKSALLDRHSQLLVKPAGSMDFMLPFADNGLQSEPVATRQKVLL